MKLSLPPVLSKPAGYLVAGVCVVLAAGLRALLDPLLGDQVPFITFFPAVVVAAWFGGMRSALLASVLGLLAAWFLFVPLRLSFEVEHAPDVVALVIYAIVSLAVAGLSGSARSAERLSFSAEREMRQQEERLRVTLSSIGDAVITTDSKGNVTSLNPVAEELTGWSEDDARGRPLASIFNIVNEETGEPAGSPVEKVLAEGRIVGLGNHTLLIAKDGRIRPIDDSAAPIRNGSGEIQGVVLVFRDVTERRGAERRLQASEARKTAMFQAALDGVITIDQESKIVEVNAACQQLFGYAAADMLGREITELLIPPDLRERHRAGMARYLATGESRILDKRIEMTALRADGSEFPIELAVTRIPTEGAPMFTAFVRDITERLRGESASRRLAAIVESSDDAIVGKDLNSIVTSWNLGAERLFGYTAEEMIGRSITTVIPSELQDEEPRILAQIRRGERIEHHEAVRRRKDGALIRVSLTISPIRDSSGRVVGASKIARDITAQKHAEDALQASETRYRTIFESAAVSLWEEDFSAVATAIQELRDGGVRDFRAHFAEHPEFVQRAMGLIRVLDVNDATVRMFEARDKAELLGSLPMIFVPESMPVFVEELVTLAEGRTYMESEALLRTVQGNPIHVLFTMRLPEPGQAGRTLFCVLDVSERKRTALALEEADRRKSEFLAVLAHELRNPIAPISNALEILRLTGANAVQAAPVIDMLGRQVSHVTRLVDDLLDVSRINRGRIELRRERVDLATLVNHAVETVRPLSESLEQRLTVELPVQPLVVDADPTRLAQILGNLLNNACKFTARSGSIHVSAQAEDGLVVIRVRDTGIGIAADQLPRIFEMFTQADSSLERVRSGLGIGLALVRILVEMHGGTVEARSEGAGRGSEFVVRLPLVTGGVDAHEPPESEPRLAELSARDILIVDDNLDSAESLALLLKLNGHRVHTVHDGLEAVRAAAELQPDAILLDIGLPKLNGYEAARRIREQRSGKKLVLVALTGWGQQEDRRRSEAAGFDAHLVKPVDHAVLARLLAGLDAG